MLINSRIFLTLAMLFFGMSAAHAHPHVWIEAKADLIFDDKNNFVAVRHVWEFDEGFSAYATQGLDENGDGKYSREELAELATVNIESVADFEYFTFVQMGEKDPKYAVPTEYHLSHDGTLLTLHFTLPMAEPVKPDPKKGFEGLTVEVFDATFFVAVEFAEGEDAIGVFGPDNGPSNCAATLKRPATIDPIRSQLLSQIGPNQNIPEHIAPEEGELSNTIRVTCPVS